MVGLSALLTTSMPFMRKTVNAFREEGKDFPIICGGAPVTRDFAEEIGAFDMQIMLLRPLQSVKVLLQTNLIMLIHDWFLS